MQLDSLATTAQPRFFIVYGHDEPLAMSVKNFLQNALKFPEPILLEEQSHSGRTIIEKLEEESASADAAIVLMTPDDLVPEGGKWRARQNVIFELGYFFGRFTRRSGRTIIIYKKTEGIDFPSDLAGIGYVPIHDSIKEASELLRREIRKAFPKSNV